MPLINCLAVEHPADEIDGKYFHTVREARAADQTYDLELAEKLWIESARLSGVT